ncbi:ZinT family metal-binding protein [Roseovarius sp. MMSF_3281]|uniref:ZinT family metal-binding protein n=1 Tax=Roseovarius sp. MMSF_3281 TaxID=3046694 RepID=UPI00353276C7
MQLPGPLGAIAISAMILTGAQALAEGTETEHDHDHDHEHAHSHDEKAERIYNGYFSDSEIKPRTLADWQGDWQSVYPYLLDGTLDPVMTHKAEHGDRTAKAYRDYYETGYRTDVDRITIQDETFTFYSDGGDVSGQYANDGYEVLTYSKGNRGVRYIFEKASGDAEAPQFVQFSDHAIAPTEAGHYHLYWGNDRAALLEEVTNWPTYYPSDLSGEEIVQEMIAH